MSYALTHPGNADIVTVAHLRLFEDSGHTPRSNRQVLGARGPGRLRLRRVQLQRPTVLHPLDRLTKV